jgi:hypothetical protein
MQSNGNRKHELEEVHSCANGSAVWDVVPQSQYFNILEDACVNAKPRDYDEEN